MLLVPVTGAARSTPSGNISGTPLPATPDCGSITCCWAHPLLVAAGVDRDVRAREHASDHAPVWIELADANAGSPRLSPHRRKDRLG